jgi:putative spermidine/putrescine transport system substrate-binding protein
LVGTTADFRCFGPRLSLLINRLLGENRRTHGRTGEVGLAVLQAEANFLALGGCLQDYDLDICTNYKDIIDSAKEPPRGPLKNWFSPFVLIVMGLVYNTKEASKPASYQDLLNPKYKGRVGIPAYGWVGNSWLQVLNKTLGGDEDNVDPGIKFLAELVKKNDAVVIENTDAALKAFTREKS